MTVDKLYDLYNNNLSSILTPYMLATISDRSYDIHGFNLINRLLIYIQNKYTTSLKSDSGWDVIGRSVKSKSSPIWVIENIIKTEYVDPDTSETISESELPMADIGKAVELGVIKRVKTVTGLKCVPLYNVKDTTVFDKNLYKMYIANEQSSVKISTLLEIAVNDFGLECRKANKNSVYDENRNILFIGNDDSYLKIKTIARAIASQIDYNNIIDDIEGIDDENLEKFARLTKLFMQESITSYCNKEYYVEATIFSEIETINFEDDDTRGFVSMLSTAYDFVEELICLMNPNNHKISESTLRKAAELLSILEANEAIMQLKG